MGILKSFLEIISFIKSTRISKRDDNILKIFSKFDRNCQNFHKENRKRFLKNAQKIRKMLQLYGKIQTFAKSLKNIFLRIFRRNIKFLEKFSKHRRQKKVIVYILIENVKKLKKIIEPIKFIKKCVKL